MTKPRRKPTSKFHAFLVEPKPGFHPTNWRQNPEHYRILEYVGPKRFKGSVDTWKFLHNHEAIKSGAIRQWAIYLDFDASIFANQNNNEPAPARISQNNPATGTVSDSRSARESHSFA